MRSVTWNLVHSFPLDFGSLPLRILLFDGRKFFDLAGFLDSVDEPARWEITRHDAQVFTAFAGENRIVVACAETMADATRALHNEDCAESYLFKIAIVPRNSREPLRDSGFDAILRSDDPRSWRAFLHGFTRDRSQLIGVDFFDFTNVWRGRIGQMTRITHGDQVLEQLMRELETLRREEAIVGLQLFFDAWTLDLGLHEIDRLSTQIRELCQDIDSLTMGSLGRSGRQPQVEMICFQPSSKETING